MKIVRSLSILLLLWGTSAAAALRTAGVVIPAFGDPAAPLILDVLAVCMGERHCCAKFSDQDIRAIRPAKAQGQTSRSIAAH